MIIVREPEAQYPTPPEGLHPGVCIDVIARPQQETPWGRKDKVELRFEIEDEATHQRYQVRAWYTASLAKKSRLRGMLETWRGRKLAEEELRGFDLEKLIGLPCQVQIVHAIGDDGRTWANVQAVIKATSSTPKMVPSPYTREQDRPSATEEEVPF